MKKGYYSDNSKNYHDAPVGGKAKGLFKLQELGFEVPKFLVIPWSSRLESERIVKDLIKNGIISNVKRYAVRSSANVEDGREHSFAGIFDSILDVPSTHLHDAVEQVFSGLNSERVSIYNKENPGLEMAVIIQEMIPADRSGIGFSVDPLTYEHKHVINATSGLGDQLVSGEVTGDHYEVKLDAIDKRKGLKDNGSNEEYFLSDKEILSVSKALNVISTELDINVDIEFCIHQDSLYLLQVRPITTLPKGLYTVYDNSNIVESYPGITTPLTFSFINLVYTKVYKQFTQLMGVRKDEIEERSEIFENTLGLVRGRVYYNLLNWYKMLAMAPGFSVNARYMETMMGVKERFNLKEDFQLNKNLARLRVFFMTMNILRIHFGLKRRTRKFLKKVEDVVSTTQNKKLKNYSLPELQQEFKSFESTLILEWKAPLINDFFSMIWFGLLKKMCESNFEEGTNLHNDLLCGSQDIISTEPMRKSLEIAEEIRKDEFWNTVFANKNSNEIVENLENQREGNIPILFWKYIHEFGDRCIGELKLESISYKERPLLFVDLIKSYLKEGLDTGVLKNIANSTIRKSAEEKVRRVFKGKPLKRLLFNHVLMNARKLVSNRENLRYERTRVFGLVREFFNIMGEKMKELNIINESRDIFYLKHDEVLSVDISSIDNHWKQVVSKRKEQFKSYHEQEPPNDRFFTYDNDFSDQFIYQETFNAFDGILKGIGCSPGIIQAKVCRVDHPEEINSVNGEIMVARSTDPGWVKLFPSAKAIIVEKGSLLSHTSIVAREMGIPCIVGVDHLLETLNNGDLIKMDGSKGTIDIIEKNE